MSKPVLIPINPKALINVAEALRGDVRAEDTKGENLCCRYLRGFECLQIPQLGIIRANINYCFVCGRRLV